MAKNIFVIGLDKFNLKKLKSLDSHRYNFRPLFTYEGIYHLDEYPIEEILQEAENKLASYPGSIDAIVGYWDFPIAEMVPLLCHKQGLPSTSLASVLKCEHKYWSRLEQSKVIPDRIPNFQVFDPFDENAIETISLEYPFWIKPIKSFASQLGFKINNNREWHDSIHIIRQHISRLGKPFNYFLKQVKCPEEIAKIPGNFCIAEDIIGGRQCTLEGYSFHGEVKIYGTIDSIREPNGSSFSRYQYPSTLPEAIQQRMREVAEKIIPFISYDNAPFNIEFFYDENLDQIWLLEINARLSQSHCDLFEKVDGMPHLKVALDLALGNQPDFPQGRGKFNCAAKFFLRRYQDALVIESPSKAEIQKIQQEIPGTLILPIAKEGMKLSELKNQDSYSYAIAKIHVCGDHPQELVEKYEKCVDSLQFEFSD